MCLGAVLKEKNCAQQRAARGWGGGGVGETGVGSPGGGGAQDGRLCTAGSLAGERRGKWNGKQRDVGEGRGVGRAEVQRVGMGGWLGAGWEGTGGRVGRRWGHVGVGSPRAFLWATSPLPGFRRGGRGRRILGRWRNPVETVSPVVSKGGAVGRVGLEVFLAGGVGLLEQKHARPYPSAVLGVEVVPSPFLAGFVRI